MTRFKILLTGLAVGQKYVSRNIYFSCYTWNKRFFELCSFELAHMTSKTILFSIGFRICVVCYVADCMLMTGKVEKVS